MTANNDSSGVPAVANQPAHGSSGAVARTLDGVLDASLRVHAAKIVEYILRGNGRRVVPNAIYVAAWEIQYALNRTSNAESEALT
jgi:hypothetical protein